MQIVLALECGLAQRETGELWAKRRELFVVGGVLFGEGLQIFGEVVYGVNGIVVTRENTCAAVGALVGINKELGDVGELRFILSRMDAIDGASFNAVLVLGAGVSDYEGHLGMSPACGGAIAEPNISEGKLLNLQELVNC